MSETLWHVAVLIPACDEEELLPCCLHAVLAAGRLLPSRVSFDIVVAVDSSTDRTYQIAQSLLGRSGMAIRTEAHRVGTARAVAAALALARYGGRMDRCWLANTDADSVVGRDWLMQQLTLAECGVRAVAGTVGVDSFAGHGLHVPERFRRTYQVHSDGSHPHVHGANLGVRADTYLEAGGWSDLATAEDHDLWNRIGVIGARRSAVSHIPVSTSGRRKGRAPHGFADALSAHNDALTTQNEAMTTQNEAMTSQNDTLTSQNEDAA